MLVSINNQVIVFLNSIAGGIIIAFIYDIFRIKRKAVKTGRIIVTVEDFTYWIIVAFVMFAVIYFSNEGEIRGFIFIGMVIGIVLYMLLLSRYVMSISLFVIKAVCNVIKALWTVLVWPFRLIFNVVGVPCTFLLRLFSKGFKTAGRIRRNRLAKTLIWSRLRKNIRRKI